MKNVRSEIGLFHAFRIFYRELGKHVPVLIGLSFLIAYVDALSVIALLPLSVQLLNRGDQVPDGISLKITEVMSGLGLSTDPRAIVALCVSLLVLKAVGKFFFQTYQAFVSAKLTRILVDKLTALLGRADYQSVLKFDTGTLSNVCTNEVNRCSAAFLGFSSVISSGLSVLFAMGMSALIDPRLTGFTAIFGLALIAFFRLANSAARRYSMAISAEASRFYGLVIQSIQSMKYMKGTNGYRLLKQSTDASILRMANLGVRAAAISGLPLHFSEPFIFLFLMFLVWLQSGSSSETAFGTVLVLAIYFYRILSEILSLQAGWSRFLGSTGSLDLVLDVTSYLEGNREVKGSVDLGKESYSIEFRGVSLSYGAKEALKDVSFSILENSFVAIVGESGSGKSTALDLITGLLKPSQGEVYLNGHALSDLDKASYRSRLGLVTQEPVLFNDTILNNISLWAGGENGHLVEKALEQAGASQFVSAREGGAQSSVGDRGGNLSGGQRQRLAIARELFKKPGLLLLDEPTSALDVESEMEFMRTVESLKGTITIVMVTHKFSLTRACDQVLVFRQGVLEEAGTFTELKSKKGYFNKLLGIQELSGEQA